MWEEKTGHTYGTKKINKKDNTTQRVVSLSVRTDLVNDVIQIISS